MKKKIAILGSTGSIGKSLLNIIYKNKNDYDVVLLAANKNYKDLIKQAKIFNAKNIILSDKQSFTKLSIIDKNFKFKVYNSFEDYDKIFKQKIDYAMCAITGLEGLNPTYKIIKHTKNIAIANKESIICAWNLLKKELFKFNTTFLPVDSEHFSIWYLIKGKIDTAIEKIYLTASGGPFLRFKPHMLKKVKIKDALKHPNWKMGKKISIDSATMMNKVFEIIEAKNIFNLTFDKLDIIIHPKSYIHSIIKFSNGITEILAHDTNMMIPIFNTLPKKNFNNLETKKIDFKVLNYPDFAKPNLKQFPILKIIKTLPHKMSLFETILVTTNDYLVNQFISGKINFTEIDKKLIKIINNNEFKKYKKIKPQNINQIIKLKKYVLSKLS